MAKVLLKHFGKKSSKNYQKNANKVSKIALLSSNGTVSHKKIYSRQELVSKYTNLSNK